MKTLTKTILAVLASGLISSPLFTPQAQADQIEGTILFTGVVTLDTASAGTSTAVTGWFFIRAGGVNLGTPLVAGADGDFTPAAGTFATFTPWTYVAAATPLWSVLAGAFTFDLAAGSSVIYSATSVTVTGFGIVHGIGFDDTPGTWSFTTQDPPAGGGPTASFSFSASSMAIPSVPEAGSTVALLGLALAGVEGLRRKLKTPKA